MTQYTHFNFLVTKLILNELIFAFDYVSSRIVISPFLCVILCFGLTQSSTLLSRSKMIYKNVFCLKLFISEFPTSDIKPFTCYIHA